MNLNRLKRGFAAFGVFWFFVLPIVIVLTAQPKQQESRVNIGHAFTNLAREYFESGMVSAMYAHQKWVNGQLLKGIIPDVGGMTLKEWKQSATRAWLEQNPKDAYIKIEEIK
jgi:hypothetical protein